MEIYATVRQLVFLQGLSRREVARRLGISRDAVAKMCRYAEPPGYVRTKAVPQPKLGAVIGVIDAIVEADDRAPAKQRHTARRIWQRLRKASEDRGNARASGTMGEWIAAKEAHARVTAKLAELESKRDVLEFKVSMHESILARVVHPTLSKASGRNPSLRPAAAKHDRLSRIQTDCPWLVERVRSPKQGTARQPGSGRQ